MVEGHKSRVIGRGSKVEGQKSRSRVKSRGRGSKVSELKLNDTPHTAYGFGGLKR
jgi:hypothetical protein